jgi:cell volume regulation protein A
MFEYFFIIGIILIIGFLATIIFQRTRISTVLILMAFGFLLGPGLGIVDATEESMIVQISSFIATLALIILLFDGGMMLDIKSVLKAVPKSTLFTFLVFIVTMTLVTVFCTLIGWDPLHGALIGAIVGGTSSAIVIAMAERAGITREARAFLTIESTITDALCIISAMVVARIIVSTTVVGAGDIGHMFLAAFLIALFMGAVAAIVWLFAIQKLRIEKYYYMLTLAVAFIVYSLTEGIDASGGFAVFVFGLTLGNARSIIRNLSMSPELAMASTSTLKRFQEEVTFFVRTFFFVYAGLLFLPNYFSFGVLSVAFIITLLALAGRKVSQRVVVNGTDFTKQDKTIITTTMPRGLAAAVLATTPAVVAVTATDFAPIIFGVIVFSNIVATLGIFFFSGEKPLGERIMRDARILWDKLNVPEEELKRIEKKEKEEKKEEEKEEEKKEEKKKKKYEKKKKKVVLEELEWEVQKEEKELKELKKKIKEEEKEKKESR